MANKPNLVTKGSATLKGQLTEIFLFGGNVEAKGKVISGVTLRKGGPKGDVLALGLTLVWVNKGYKLSQPHLTKYYEQIVVNDQMMEANEWMPFVNAISDMLKGKTTVHFSKQAVQ